MISEERFRAEWKKLTVWADKKNRYIKVQGRDKNGNPIWRWGVETQGTQKGFFSYGQFKEQYEEMKNKGIKNPVEELKFQLTSQQSKSTIYGELNYLGLDKTNRKELNRLKKITSQDFYNENKAAIEAKRAEFKLTTNSYNANKLIASYFFGSD